MSDDLKMQFLSWWESSYPHARPSGHTITTHVSFAEHVLDQKRIAEIRELAALMNEEPCH